MKNATCSLTSYPTYFLESIYFDDTMSEQSRLAAYNEIQRREELESRQMDLSIELCSANGE